MLTYVRVQNLIKRGNKIRNICILRESIWLYELQNNENKENYQTQYENTREGHRGARNKKKNRFELCDFNFYPTRNPNVLLFDKQ